MRAVLGDMDVRVLSCGESFRMTRCIWELVLLSDNLLLFFYSAFYAFSGRIWNGCVAGSSVALGKSGGGSVEHGM